MSHVTSKDMKVKVYKQSGAAAGEIELDDSVFGCAVNEALIHETAVAQAANARQGTKSTLTRSEVRGGGAKPWRQKGTGRARQGSIRSPQWKKGGVVFAPKPRDFGKKVNKQAKRAATLSALSSKVRDNELIVVDIIQSTGKTKEIAAMLRALKVDCSALLVLTEKDNMAVRAAGNIGSLTTIAHEFINVLDIVNNVKLIVTKEAVKEIEKAYADPGKEGKAVEKKAAPVKEAKAEVKAEKPAAPKVAVEKPAAAKPAVSKAAAPKAPPKVAAENTPAKAAAAKPAATKAPAKAPVKKATPKEEAVKK